MAGVVRKRTREAPASGSGARVKRLARHERRRAAMEADEIWSGSSGDDDDDDAASAAAEEEEDGEGESSGDEGETVEAKRLRLARKYLKKVGIDADGDDEGIERLQDEARKAGGGVVREIAASIGRAGVTVREVGAHGLAATCVGVGRDGGRAVSGGKDSSVIVWDVEAGAKVVDMRPRAYEKRWRKEAWRAPGHVGHVFCVAVGDEGGGNSVASGGQDGLVRIWDVRSGEQVEALQGHRGAVTSVAFRQGSQQLFSGSTDRTVKIWNVDEMAYVETLFGHGGDVVGVDSFVKERAVSCGRDGTMRLYKVLDGSQLVFRRARTTSIDAVAMVSEQRFVSGGDDGCVALWHVNKKRPVACAEKAHGAGTGADAWVSAVSAGRNSDVAASGAGDGVIRLWQCSDKPPALRQVGAVESGPGFVNGLAFGGECRVLIAAIGQEPRLGRWEKQRAAKSGVRFISMAQPE